MSVTPFTYDPQVGSQIYGLHVPYNKGYDAASQRRRPAAFRRAEDKAASGYLLRGNGAQIALWITDVTADFSLNGQTGQSRMLREFYPRSFNDVKLHITGNVSSTYEYNRLALFIREHQWLALNYVNQGGTGIDQTITFGLYDKTPEAFRTGNTKGAHLPWQVQGYVTTIAAGAVAHNVAPQFEIDFVVCDTSSDNKLTGKSNTAIWKELLVSSPAYTTFVGLVNKDVQRHNTFEGYIPNPTPHKPPHSTPPPAKVQLPQVWTVGVTQVPTSGFPIAPGGFGLGATIGESPTPIDNPLAP